MHADQPHWHNKLEAAIGQAQRAADVTGLPQTVYRNAETCGWANTNALANVLARSEVAVTILPTRYFI